MATLVSFHAHPDDECIACGGIIRKASDEGHRVVLVVATRGEQGEVPEGFLDPGEELWQRRVAETHKSAEILGAQRVEFLGYLDSGMMGTPANGAPGSFWTAPVDEAAKKLAALLDEETFGMPESVITAAVDVTPYLEYKRRAMRAHASQISEQSFFLAMPDEAFAYAFGTEWFIREGQGPGITETELLADL